MYILLLVIKMICIVLNMTMIKNDKIRDNYCLTIDRGVREINDYCFIPIDFLIKLLYKYYRIFINHNIL